MTNFKLLCATAVAASFMVSACAHKVPAVASGEEPRVSVDLSDVGDVYMQNSGHDNAQQSFQHGLAQMHNFEYKFAAADFQAAQELDPDFALAYWGEAMTHNHPIWMRQDKEAALKALNKYAPSPAARQAKAPTGFARDLLAATDILYGDGDKQDRDDLYLAHMAKLYAKYPGNVEIASFYALAIMGSAHEGREFGLYMQSAAITQRFMPNYPRHPGIAHYLIHATDDPVHAPLGLAAANAYGDIAPNAGHPQHMTTHIFLALGDWDGVIRANVRAAEITNTIRAADGKGPSGCGHYTSWLMYGYLQKGQRDKAHDIMSLCYQNVQNTDRGGTRYYYAWQRSLYLLDTGEWNGDVAKMSADLDDHRGANFETQIMNGLVAVKTGDIAGANTALDLAKEIFAASKKKWAEDGLPADYSRRKISEIKLLQLRAQILLAQSQNDEALKLLRQAVALEMDIPFGFGPPQPAKPSLELLGEALVQTGNYAEAVTVLKTSLSRTPGKALSLKASAAAEAGLAAD
jgi:tetratricopeptide (TPR) repeat protein